MNTIGFEQAINIAKDELEKIQSDAADISVEQAVITDDDKLYEITLAYLIRNKDSSDITESTHKELPTAMQQLSLILQRKRVYKTFIVNATNGQFRGFKKFSEN